MTRITLTQASGGDPYNLSDYTVAEDGGNLNASTLNGGVPQISATLTDFPGSQRLMDDLVTVSDDQRGSISGTVRGISRSSGQVTITADHPMTLLNTYRSVPPFANSRFDVYIPALLSYLGISLTASIHASVGPDVFAYPGFVGNVLDQLKMLCSARGYVLAPTNTGIEIRAARLVSLSENGRTSSSDDLNSQQAAQQIVVNYLNYSSYGTFSAYPPVGSNPADITPISVGSGETVVQTFQMNGTANAVTQPTVVDSITFGASNQYAVIGNDGLPITAAQWKAQGGSLTVRVLPDDPSILEVTVIGANNSVAGPYRIAESSGNAYSALYVSATGYSTSPASVTIATGAPPNVTSEAVGVTVDNPYIDTLANAYTRGMIVAAQYAGPTYTINDAAYQLNSPTGSLTFGTSVGNRLLRTNQNLIVTSTNVNASGVSYNAILDTVFNDFNTVWSGKTFDAFNTLWSGYTFNEMTSIPLRSV